MKEDRLSIVNNILQKRENTEYMIGECYDPSSKQCSALNVKLSKDSKVLQELESMGFKAIYPAELADEEIARMDEAEKFSYESHNQYALIVDSKEPHLSLELASQIVHHVYSNSRYGMINGVDTVANTITTHPDYTQFKEGAHESLQSTLANLGYKADLNGDSLTVHSEIPYPSVDKFKLAKIFDIAKDKIHSVAEKLGLNKNKQSKIKQDDDMTI